MAIIPTLSCEDAELFYKLWIPMLEFTNQQYHVINSDIHFFYHFPMDIDDVKPVAQFIWEHISCIEDYLEQAKLPREHEDIVRRWKERITDTFVIERHLRKGSVFISEKSNVYMVKGLYSSFDEIIPCMPMIVKATLLPFKDVIISDGVIVSYPIIVGSGMAKCYKDIYIEAKNNNKIITSL